MIRVYIKINELEKIMAEQNLSVRGFAKKLNISNGYLSQLLNEDRYPSAKIRQKFQDALDKKFDDLFYLESENKVNKYETGNQNKFK